jgi:hypothetical protein
MCLSDTARIMFKVWFTLVSYLSYYILCSLISAYTHTHIQIWKTAFVICYGLIVILLFEPVLSIDVKEPRLPVKKVYSRKHKKQ